MSSDEKMVKVFFALECEGNWPPVSVESVWAKSTSEPDQYLIENTPFFVQSATLGDLVIAKHRHASDEIDATVLWFEERVKWAENSLIRLILRNQGAKIDMSIWLEHRGCICEGLDSPSMLAVSVPPAVDQATIQKYLNQREEAGDVYVEEAMLRR